MAILLVVETDILRFTRDLLNSSGKSSPALTPALQAAVNMDRVALLTETPIEAVTGIRRSDSFPDLELTDQNGHKHRFRTDLVRDRIVCIAFFYTNCTGTCPGTIYTMKRLRETLKDEFSRDSVRFIAVSLDPEVDQVVTLAEYAAQQGIQNTEDVPEWLFCTGDYDDIETLRRSLGLYELDPVLDADRTQHGALFTIGNDCTDRWTALPSGLTFNDLTETFLRIAGTSERQRFATRLSRSAEFMFTSTNSHEPPCCAQKTIDADKPACCAEAAKQKLQTVDTP